MLPFTCFLLFPFTPTPAVRPASAAGGESVLAANNLDVFMYFLSLFVAPTLQFWVLGSLSLFSPPYLSCHQSVPTLTCLPFCPFCWVPVPCPVVPLVFMLPCTVEFWLSATWSAHLNCPPACLHLLTQLCSSDG